MGRPDEITRATPKGASCPGIVHPDLDGIQREIGVKDDGRQGPLVLITAAMHGNEPGGVRAVRALFDALKDVRTGGRIVGLVGNLTALSEGVRHHGQDLNRLWTEENLRGLASRSPEDDTRDETELRALFSAIEAERDAARSRARRVVLLDLHSTSADGGAFSVVPDSIPSRRMARDIGLPVVLGLEQRIEGPLLTWLVAQGDTATVVEGGQHEEAQTCEVLLASLFVALDHVGVLPEGDSRIASARRTLAEAAGDAPPVLDLIYAHKITDGDGFEMNPDWTNFQHVEFEQPLATEGPPEARKVVPAPVDGYMLMPLYQGLGTEGFFLCRKVTARWLFLSRLLRGSWAEYALRFLPGIHSVQLREGRVVARRKAPRWLVRVLHLFGFRKNAPTGETTVWTRRPQAYRSR